MSETADSDAAAGREPESFADIPYLRNHWSGTPRPPAYYWYLGFAEAPGARSLAARCQQAIAFPYYDPVPPQDLHMTLTRIAAETDITAAQLTAVEDAARRACRSIAPFQITLGPLSGTRGAVGFEAAPVRPVTRLREALRTATMLSCRGVVVANRTDVPHMTIAYANTDDVPAVDVIAAVAGINDAGARAEAAVEEVKLVLLERRDRSYAWKSVARIPLEG